MARLRNVNSGAVVSVPDEKVARLGTEWVVVKDEKPVKPNAKQSKK